MITATLGGTANNVRKMSVAAGLEEERRSRAAWLPSEMAWSLIAGVRRGLCAIRGHDLICQCKPRRLSLRCLDCGWESSGWTIDAPRFSYTSDRPA